MLGKKKFFFYILILSFAVFYSFTISCAEEEITITTYYPSPYGSYKELHWGDYPNTRGTLSSDQGSSIELGGKGTPYIDFSNDMSPTNDYDARIRLRGDDELAIEGIKRINTCVLVRYGHGTTYCPRHYYVTTFRASPLTSVSGYMLCCMVENPP